MKIFRGVSVNLSIIALKCREGEGERERESLQAKHTFSLSHSAAHMQDGTPGETLNVHFQQISSL